MVFKALWLTVLHFRVSYLRAASAGFRGAVVPPTRRLAKEVRISVAQIGARARQLDSGKGRNKLAGAGVSGAVSRCACHVYGNYAASGAHNLA